MNIYDLLAKRAVGELPLSVGTSLAMEALKEGTGYGGLWINLRTLYRNIYEAFGPDERQQLSQLLAHNSRDVVRGFADTLEEELGQILEFGGGRLEKVTLYHREYADLLKRFPHAILRTPNTPLQKQYNNLMNDTIDEVLLRPIRQHLDFDRGSQLQGEPTKALIITHYPVDLLSSTSFTKLRLLESYTGAIKSRSQWNTKLTDGKLFPRIPFNYLTVQIFGDGPVSFMRYPKPVRDALVQLADQYKWTSVTTTEKMKQNIAWMKDQYAAEALRRLF